MYDLNSEVHKTTQPGEDHSGVLSNSDKMDHEDFIMLIKNELDLVNTNHFADMVNQVYYNALFEHFG